MKPVPLRILNLFAPAGDLLGNDYSGSGRIRTRASITCLLDVSGSGSEYLSLYHYTLGLTPFW